MKILSAICGVFILTLSSCEGFIQIQGHTFDSNTKQPIENVQVVLLLKGKDTMRRIQLEYDTISYSQRKVLRKNGIKDDYWEHDRYGLSRYALCNTDTTGRFKIGDILVGCVPKCLDCQVIFIKDGYKTMSIKKISYQLDSLRVYLERVPTIKKVE
jgi:hypothetical protein